MWRQKRACGETGAKKSRVPNRQHQVEKSKSYRSKLKGNNGQTWVQKIKKNWCRRLGGIRSKVGTSAISFASRHWVGRSTLPISRSLTSPPSASSSKIVGGLTSSNTPSTLHGEPPKILCVKFNVFFAYPPQKKPSLLFVSLYDEINLTFKDLKYFRSGMNLTLDM